MRAKEAQFEVITLRSGRGDNFTTVKNFLQSEFVKKKTINDQITSLSKVKEELWNLIKSY